LESRAISASGRQQKCERLHNHRQRARAERHRCARRHRCVAARSAGLTVSPALLARPDEVIEYTGICCTAFWSRLAHRRHQSMSAMRSLSRAQRTPSNGRKGTSCTSMSAVSIPTPITRANSEEKREPVSDIETAVVDSLKALDPKRPIREADIILRLRSISKH
jgi:hypothetical protein